MHGANGCYGNVTRCDAHGRAGGIDLVFTHARNHGPGVLTAGMHVRADALTGFDGPGDDGGIARLVHHRAYGLSVIRLQVVGNLKDSSRHGGAPA